MYGSALLSTYPYRKPQNGNVYTTYVKKKWMAVCGNKMQRDIICCHFNSSTGFFHLIQNNVIWHHVTLYHKCWFIVGLVPQFVGVTTLLRHPATAPSLELSLDGLTSRLWYNYWVSSWHVFCISIRPTDKKYISVILVWRPSKMMKRVAMPFLNIPSTRQL